MSLQDIATELGIPVARTRKLLERDGHWLRAGRRKGRITTYDAAVIERLRAMLGQPHRQVQDPEHDWLSRYQGEANARGHAGPQHPQPPRPPESGAAG